MAQKRMFNMKIVDSDAFLDMPLSTQCLYFHLNMRADDDGFVGNPRRIVRLINANDDDLKLLLTKKFILAFESGVIVIKHWRIHNTISSNAYNETSYLEEKAMLLLKDNKSYSLNEGLPIDDSALIARRSEQAENAKCKKNAKKMLPDKIREDKDSVDKEEISEERNTLTGIEKESPQKSKRLSLEEAKQAVLNSDLSTDLVDALLLWLEYKYLDRKDKYAERGMTQLISSARACAKEYGALPAARIVKYSIEREWQGVLWEKAKDYADKQAPKAYEHGSVFYRAAKTLSKRVSDRLGLPEDSEETKQAWAAELEALSREMNIDPDGDMREALFFSQESDYWKGRVLDAKSFRRNFRQILSDMRRRDGA